MWRSLKVFLAVVVTFVGATQPTCAEEPLLLTNQRRIKAELVSSEKDGTLQFRSGQDTIAVPLQELVRWSFPRQNLESQELILVDGSRLVLADSWSGKSSLQLEADMVMATTKLLGEITLPRSALRAILLSGPATSTERPQFVDRLLSFQDAKDRLLLSDGDVLQGELSTLSSSKPSESPAVTFTLNQQTQPISFPSDRVAAVVLGSEQEFNSKGDLAVGLSDGSYLKLLSLIADDGSVEMDLATNIQIHGDRLSDIVHLQSFVPETVYLSDLPAAEYQHKPYLDIPWPYKHDRNVLGGPLRVDGDLYAKGLGLHTFSSLSFEIPKVIPETTLPATKHGYKRFAAALAVDDAAKDRGSVVFKVILVKENERRLAFTSPVVRGGDAPLPISVELGEADRLILAAEFADRGDERDYADWLDARLENN